MAFAYPLTLSARQLVKLLSSLETNFRQAVLESVADIQFVSVAHSPDDFHFDSTFEPRQWERGRAFGEQMELRWRWRSDQFAVLVVSELRLTLPVNAQQEIELPEPVMLEHADGGTLLQAILWGEWQDPRAEPDLPDPNRQWWYEERVPKFLGYPWDAPTERLAVEVVRYRAPKERGEESFPSDFIYRFVRLLPVTISQGKVPLIEEEEVFEEEEGDDQPL